VAEVEQLEALHKRYLRVVRILGKVALVVAHRNMGGIDFVLDRLDRVFLTLI